MFLRSGFVGHNPLPLNNAAMSRHIQAATLLIKCCPEVFVEDVVSAVEAFGFSRSLLAAPLNVSNDQALQTTSSELSQHVGGVHHLHSSQVIYIKTNDEVSAASMLKSFVEDELNSTNKTAMYCLELKPRNYLVHFILLLTHSKGAPTRKALEDLFAPFCKCSIRTKDQKMTYVNFPLFEQVVLVLKALEGAMIFCKKW